MSDDNRKRYIKQDDPEKFGRVPPKPPMVVVKKEGGTSGGSGVSTSGKLGQSRQTK